MTAKRRSRAITDQSHIRTAVVVVGFAVLAICALLLPRERPVSVSTRRVATMPIAVVREPPQSVEAQQVSTFLASIQRASDDAFYQSMAGIGAEVGEYLASFPVPVPQPTPPSKGGAPMAGPAGGGGGGSTSSHGPHSATFWWGVAICEQGGRNDPFYGFLSYMDGSAAGLSWEQQVAKANATIAQYGDRISQGGAWADACIDAGYREAPGG